MSLLILMAEDDDDHFLIVRKIIDKHLPMDTLVRVKDGQELLDYLRRAPPYCDPPAQRPDLILLDLNMPRKTGHEALREIRSEEDLKEIPIVIFTVSREARDVKVSYQLGASSFITKPASFEQIVHTMQVIDQYWFKTVRLPNDR
jgi:CheY-like chemotaxis protein